MLIFIFKDASPSLYFPVLRRQTPSPKLLRGDQERSVRLESWWDPARSCRAWGCSFVTSCQTLCPSLHYSWIRRGKKSSWELLSQLGDALREYKV